jgi:hypothetical protein
VRAQARRVVCAARGLSPQNNIMLGLSHNWVIVLARRKPIVATKQTPIGNNKRSRNSAEPLESAAQF